MKIFPWDKRFLRTGNILPFQVGKTAIKSVSTRPIPDDKRVDTNELSR